MEENKTWKAVPKEVLKSDLEKQQEMAMDIRLIDECLKMYETLGCPDWFDPLFLVDVRKKCEHYGKMTDRQKVGVEKTKSMLEMKCAKRDEQ